MNTPIKLTNLKGLGTLLPHELFNLTFDLEVEGRIIRGCQISSIRTDGQIYCHPSMRQEVTENFFGDKAEEDCGCTG